STGAKYAVDRLTLLNPPIDDFAGKRPDVRICTAFGICGEIGEARLGNVVFAHVGNLVAVGGQAAPRAANRPLAFFEDLELVCVRKMGSARLGCMRCRLT